MNTDFTVEQALENAVFLLSEAESFVGLDDRPAAIDLLDRMVAFQQMVEKWMADRENA